MIYAGDYRESIINILKHYNYIFYYFNYIFYIFTLDTYIF